MPARAKAVVEAPSSGRGKTKDNLITLAFFLAIGVPMIVFDLDRRWMRLVEATALAGFAAWMQYSISFNQFDAPDDLRDDEFYKLGASSIASLARNGALLLMLFSLGRAFELPVKWNMLAVAVVAGAAAAWSQYQIQRGGPEPPPSVTNEQEAYTRYVLVSHRVNRKVMGLAALGASILAAIGIFTDYFWPHLFD